MILGIDPGYENMGVTHSLFKCREDIENAFLPWPLSLLLPLALNPQNFKTRSEASQPASGREGHVEMYNHLCVQILLCCCAADVLRHALL